MVYQTNNASEKEKPAGKKTAVPTELLTSLQFSESTKQLEDLKAIIFNAPDLNQSKIQFLKEEIAGGRYQIQSNHLATKLIEYYQLNSVPEPA